MKNVKNPIIERRIYQTALYQDGLVDIFIGSVLLGNSFGAMFYEMGMPLPLNYMIISIPVYLAFLLTRSKITTPRLGYVKFGGARKKKNKILLIVNVGAVATTLGVLLISKVNGWPPFLEGRINMLVIGLIGFVIPISLVGYFKEFNRLSIFAWLILLAWFVYAEIRGSIPGEWGWVLTFGMVGLIFMILGTVLFVRFLKKYPLIKSKDEEAEYVR